MNIREALDTLREDYSLRDSLLRKKLSVHEELEDEIEDLEQAIITSRIIPELKEYAQKLLADLRCDVYLSVVKSIGGDVTVSNEYISEDPGQDVVAESDGTESDDSDGSEEQSNCDGSNSQPEAIVMTRQNTKLASGKDLRVTFADGTIFEDNNAKKVFIDTIKKIGLIQVRNLNIRLMNGCFNLVDKSRRTGGDKVWQEYVDGFWIYINMSNRKKVIFLLEIKERLGIDMTIEAVGNIKQSNLIKIIN